MFAHALLRPSSPTYWERLTNTAYWQVILALIVAYTTYFLTDYSKRKRQLRVAKSQAIRYGYELQQLYSNRLQSELNFECYQRISQIRTSAEDKKYFLDLAKHESWAQPEQAIAISQTRGRLIEQYGDIELLSRRLDFESIRNYVDDFVYQFGSLYVKNVGSEVDTAEKVEALSKTEKKNIEKLVEEKIRRPNENLQKKLQGIRLRVL